MKQYKFYETSMIEESILPKAQVIQEEQIEEDKAPISEDLLQLEQNV